MKKITRAAWLSKLFNSEKERNPAFKRGLKYFTICLALGAACFSAPALARDSDDWGDAAEGLVKLGASSGKPYEPYYDKSKYKTYSAEALYLHG